jgi:hypothetical protein
LTLWIPALSLRFRKGSPRRQAAYIAKVSGRTPFVATTKNPVGGPVYSETIDARRSIQETEQTRSYRPPATQ